MISEHEIRKLSKETLLLRYPGALVRDELGVLHGDNRVDVAMLTEDELIGIEVKSEADNLLRLPDQVASFSKVFDRMHLFCASKHFDDAKALCPPWWGLWAVREVEGGYLLDHYQRAHQNPNVSAKSVVQLMWKQEIFKALRKDGKGKGMSSKSVWQLTKLLTDTSTVEVVRKHVRDALRSRGFEGEWALS